MKHITVSSVVLEKAEAEKKNIYIRKMSKQKYTWNKVKNIYIYIYYFSPNGKKKKKKVSPRKSHKSLFI